MRHRYAILSFLIGLALSIANLSHAQLDFGDAPDPTYPTLMASNGASHLVGIVFLGNQVDFEANGQPNLFASGDDLNTSDDEDGIIFTNWLISGQLAPIVVTASTAGFLSAWIDFNGNGSWADAGEQIFAAQALNPGQNNLAFTLPPTVTNYTYARFRFSSIPVNHFTGMLPDGEVEDYYVYLGTPNIGNVIMDPDPGLSFTQNELSMTYEPVSGNLVTAYNDNPNPGGPGIGISYSSDRGVTWTASQLPIPASTITGATFLDAFDPTITSDDAGNTFAAHISTDYAWATGPESGLFVHKSTDGGMNWSVPVPVDSEAGANGSPDPNHRFNDRCQIRADLNPSSPYYNNIYIAWIKDRGWNSPQPWSDIYVSVSTDGGNNFSSALQINAMVNDLGNMPVPAVASNGDVYVLWMHYNVITGGNGVMLLDKSTDGGVSWGGDVTVDTIVLPPLMLNGGTDVRAKGAAVIRTHQTNSNILYIVYAAQSLVNPGDEADIFFIKSTDGGSNWTAPLKLNDDVTTNDQVLPWMEIKANGTIDVVWYDRRNDANDLMWDVFATTSIDEGASFAANTKLNATTFATPQSGFGRWFGEYLALTVSDSTAHVGFTSSAIDMQGDVVYTSFTNPRIIISSESLEESPLDLKIYPNPTRAVVYLELPDGMDFWIDVFDYNGRSLLSRRADHPLSVIDMREYASGIYFIQITDKNNPAHTFTRKVEKL